MEIIYLNIRQSGVRRTTSLVALPPPGVATAAPPEFLPGHYSSWRMYVCQIIDLKKETLEKTFKARRFMVLQYSSLLFIGCKRQKKLSTRIFGDGGEVPFFRATLSSEWPITCAGFLRSLEISRCAIGVLEIQSQLQAVCWVLETFRHHTHMSLYEYFPLYPRTKMARSHAVCMATGWPSLFILLAWSFRL